LSQENVEETIDTQQQMFKDALKLGSAIMQLINAHRRKMFKYKLAFFDKWKLQTLIAYRSNCSST